MKVTDEMLNQAVEVYRPSGQEDRRTTREAMRDALEAVLNAQKRTPMLSRGNLLGGSNGMRIHARTMTVSKAMTEMSIACAEIAVKHDLTTAEWVHCLAQMTPQTTKYLLREERHPDEPGKKADEA